MELKERILKGAEELFFHLGVKSVTMDQIASQLGVSKKTIYQLVKDKNELVCKVTERHLKVEEDAMERIAGEAQDPVDEILRISEYTKRIFQKMDPSTLFELEKYYPQAWKIFQEHKDQCFHQSILRNLVKGKEQGLYREDLDVELIATLRMEMLQIGFNPFLFPPSRYSIHHVQLQILDHFLHGICTLKGHKLINKYKQIQEEE